MKVRIEAYDKASSANYGEDFEINSIEEFYDAMKKVEHDAPFSKFYLDLEIDEDTLSKSELAVQVYKRFFGYLPN